MSGLPDFGRVATQSYVRGLGTGDAFYAGVEALARFLADPSDVDPRLAVVLDEARFAGRVAASDPGA